MVSKSRKVWFISDTHFGHDRIREYCRPQFSTADEMDDCMITNWRETVGDGDLVYHLGDFAWGTANAVRVRPLLTGTIRLIIGNHDEIVELAAAKLFQRMTMWRMFPEYGFHATHVPMRRGQIRRELEVNVHGHVHGDTKNLEDCHIDVSVESTDFRPLSSTLLTSWAAARKKNQGVYDRRGRTSE